MNKCKTVGCNNKTHSFMTFCNKCHCDQIIVKRSNKTDEELTREEADCLLDEQYHDMPGGFW